MWMLFQARKLLREYIGLRRLSWGDLMKSQFAKAGDEDASLVPGVSREELDDFWQKGADSAGVSPKSYSPQILPCALYEQATNSPGANGSTAETWLTVMSSIIGARQPKGQEGDETIVFEELGDSLNHPFLPRLLAWLDQHNEDDLAVYWKRLAKQVSDSFNDLAAQKKDPVLRNRWPDEGLDRDECRRIFVALILYSYYYVGQCYQAFCQEIRESIKPPLSDEETALFNRMHMARAALANLPAALLVERLPLLRPALVDLWTLAATEDDDTVASHLPALLRSYALLVAAKRSADRMRHRGTNPRLQSLSNEESSVAPAMEGAVSVADDAVAMSEVYESLHDEAKPTALCSNCGAADWRFESDDASDPYRDPDCLNFTYKCAKCARTRIVPLDYERTRALLASEEDF